MSQTQETKFVRRVRSEMREQGLSIRGLARRMDPLNIDRARRNLHRWLDDGITPSRASIDEIAEALNVDAAELDPDDEEERDPVADLMSAITRIVQQQVAALVQA